MDKPMWEVKASLNEDRSATVTAPPCVGCKHWRPVVKGKQHPAGMMGATIVCCHVADMQHDFSCYEEKI